jgi:hypothetical protein
LRNWETFIVIVLPRLRYTSGVDLMTSRVYLNNGRRVHRLIDNLFDFIIAIRSVLGALDVSCARSEFLHVGYGDRQQLTGSAASGLSTSDATGL